MSLTQHPVDSSGITPGAGIPDADLDHLVAATVVGAVPPPPSWCQPDAKPDHGIKDGLPVAFWLQDFGAAVWIETTDRTNEDGQIVRDVPTIELGIAPKGMTAAEARELGRALIAAAEAIEDEPW